MGRSVSSPATSAQLAIGEMRPAMLKADLSKGEAEDVPAIVQGLRNA